MLKEANKIVTLIDSKYTEGSKELLMGYIFALQGHCDDAAAMFNKAQEINPNVCIPESYRGNCR